MSFFHRLLAVGSLAAILMTSRTASALETVAITEYIEDVTGSETTGEWLELYNYGNTPVVMTNWVIKDDDTDAMTVPAGTTIGAKNFLIFARSKTGFESLWLNGVPDSRVIQNANFTGGSGTFAFGDTGGDEIVLLNASSQIVWRMAYGAMAAHAGRATFYALDDFSTTNTIHGTKATTQINRNGIDPPTGRLDYEGNEYTVDPWAYSAAGDFGSPLRGNYSGAVNPPPQPTNWTLSLTTTSKYMNPGVRGLAIADQALDRHDNSDQTGIVPSLERVTGSSLRGVSGGLNADIYDWRTRNGNPRPTTLEFMRHARDTSSTLFITANIRGLTIPDVTSPTTHRMYYTTNTAVLAGVAADWVRYTNRIAQIYHQGDTISDPRDVGILNSLTWKTGYVNEFGTADNFTTLTAVGEPPVPPVKYWEIGNEPNVSLANAYSTTNAYTFTGTAGNSTPADYANRYMALTNAMLAEDPTIKVGPCITNARAGNAAIILTALLQTTATIHFISYHPYGSMGDTSNAIVQQDYLGGVYTEQKNFQKDIKDLVALYRPAQVNTMEYSASETNVSDFPTNNQFQESTMSHALGSVESVMSWGRLGLTAAHYWIWITFVSPNFDAFHRDYDRFPVSMAFEKMRDKLGDKLIGSFDANDKVHIHVVGSYTTSTVHVWAMNFANSQDIPFQLSLINGPGAAGSRVTKEVLQATSGPTNLFSANLAPDQAGGPVRQVDWTAPIVMPGADPTNLNLTLPAATLTLLTIENLAPAAVADWSMY